MGSISIIASLVFSNVCPIPFEIKELFPARMVKKVTAVNNPEISFFTVNIVFHKIYLVLVNARNHSMY